ncbi:MAG: hypothetical protein JXL80_03555 [Planctomycetes bacterium]|nr:hypothetical protein [Planctomycetota bacterium]
MTLSDQDREALRAHWLGEPLPAELERLLAHVPRGKKRRRRHIEAHQYLASLPNETERRMRRLVLAYGPTAVVLLGELIQGESKDLARRAAVDMMRLYGEFHGEERTEQAAETGAAERSMVGALSDAQVETVLGILADAGAAAPSADDATTLHDDPDDEATNDDPL